MSGPVSSKRRDEPIHERVEREKLFKEQQAKLLAQVQLVAMESGSEVAAPRPRSSRRKRRSSASHPARTSASHAARTSARRKSGSTRRPASARRAHVPKPSSPGSGGGLVIGLVVAALAALLLLVALR